MILENDFRHKTKGCVHAPLVERVRSVGRWPRISITKTKVRVAFLNENQCAELGCHEFLLKTRWVHARAWARRVRRRQSELLCRGRSVSDFGPLTL